MSLERVLFVLAVVGLVLGAALCAGCLGDETQPGGRVSATQPPVPDTGGVSGGTPPAVGATTLPIPIPLGS
jgi:hypothetical protein